MSDEIQSFPVKAPVETLFYSFDFVDDLKGATIASIISVTMTQHSGGIIDPDPSAMIGDTNVIAGTVVSQLITGGIPGLIYHLAILILTNNGQEMLGSGYVPVENR